MAWNGEPPAAHAGAIGYVLAVAGSSGYRETIAMYNSRVRVWSIGAGSMTPEMVVAAGVEYVGPLGLIQPGPWNGIPRVKAVAHLLRAPGGEKVVGTFSEASDPAFGIWFCAGYVEAYASDMQRWQYIDALVPATAAGRDALA